MKIVFTIFEIVLKLHWRSEVPSEMNRRDNTIFCRYSSFLPENVPAARRYHCKI